IGGGDRNALGGRVTCWARNGSTGRDGTEAGRDSESREIWFRRDPRVFDPPNRPSIHLRPRISQSDVLGGRRDRGGNRRGGRWTRVTRRFVQEHVVHFQRRYGDPRVSPERPRHPVRRNPTAPPEEVPRRL